MAMNVNQITAQLARLPDQALRTVAQMHKSDPYMMALVAGESARRKELRTAATPQTPDMQPTVADQLIASLPEDQGIARLPMQTEFAAEGGIVGYADGGVARFNGDTGSDVPPIESAATQGELIERARRRRLEAERQAGDWAPTEADVRGRTIKSMLPFPLNVAAEAIGFTGGAAPAESSGPPVSQRTLDARDARAMQPAQPAPSPAPAPARTAPRPASGIAQLAAPRAPAVDPRKQAMEDAKYFFDQIKPRDTETGAKKLEEIEAKSVAAREKARKEYLAALPKDQIGAEAEARYKKEAEAEPERRKEALYMALVEAGLGMMASRSPYALQGIGEGAMRGVGSYKNAMKELDSLARSRNEALDSISKARRAEQMGNAKEAYEYAQTADSNANKFAKEMFNFVQGRKDLDQQDKMNIMKSIYADFNADARLATELRSREKVAGMQLAARTDQMDTLNAQYAAAVRAGDTKRAEETLSIIRNLRGAPRGALTDAQENAIVAKFFDRRPIAETVYSADPTYRQAVLAAAARGETPPMPTQEQIRASRAPRVQPGSITPVGQ